MATRLRVPSRVSFALLLIVGSVSLSAQQVTTYGVDSTSIAVVSAWDMEPFESQTTWASSELNAYRYLTNAGVLYGIVHAPEGASLLSVELDACDTSPTKGVGASLSRMDPSGITVLAVVSTGDA